MVGAHLAVADAVDHLVVLTVEGVCQEAQALQQNRDVADQFTAGSQSSCDDSAAQSESPPCGCPFSLLWPAPSHDRPGSLCRLSRSRCSRWGWWHFQRWCWRSVRRWMWRWTGSPSSCWATAAHSGIWWRELDLNHPVSPSTAVGGGSSPPRWSTQVRSSHIWWLRCVLNAGTWRAGQIRDFNDPPHSAAPFSPAPTGAPRWDCLLWASTRLGSLLHAHKPLMCPAPSSSFAASLLKTKHD